MKHNGVDVDITPGRWDVTIAIHKDGQPVQTYIASADAAYTFRDGIWFGTQAEYEETGAI